MKQFMFRFYFMFLRRLKNRLKPLVRIRELWSWEYESCERCGCCFKLAYGIVDNMWERVYGSDSGCLCLNCFIERALENNIYLDKNDIEWLILFYGDGGTVPLIRKEQE